MRFEPHPAYTLFRTMKRLLFIAHRMPFPPDKGERVRAYHQLRVLARSFDITLAAQAAADDPEAVRAGLKDFTSDVLFGDAGGAKGLVYGGASLLAGGCVTRKYFHSGKLARQIRTLAADKTFDVVFGYSSSTLDLILSVPARARIMDLVDVDSLKWRAYAKASLPPKRWLYAAEARGVKRLEDDAIAKCDAVLLVSEAEAAALASEGGNVHAVGNGVDLEFFAPGTEPATSRRGLVFAGSMDYRPNIDGVCWFAEAIWPALRKRHEDLTFTIVGRDPSPEVRQLAATPGIEVTGAVDDVRPYVHKAAVSIAPLRIARGIQNKVLEAMAMAKAVVASPAAMEGIDATLGTEYVLAETPDEWVERLGKLLADPAAADALGGAARRRVEQDYSWDGRLQHLEQMCVRLAEAGDAASVKSGSRNA